MHASATTASTKICIIGAGISGLACAWERQRKGGDCTVLEQSEQPGGAIRSYHDGDYLAEEGPHSILLNSTKIENFLNSIPDLQSSIVESDPGAKKRFVLRDGKPHSVPLSPLAAVTTSLWSLKGKLRALKELFIKAAPVDCEESIADFVRRRLGDELYHYAVNPMVAGIYAGDPEVLSLKHTFPKLYALEQDHGGLLRGMIRTMKLSRKNKERKPTRRILSFKNGMAELPEKLASALGESLSTDVSIESICKSGKGWEVTWTDSTDKTSEDTFDQLILTVPAHRLKNLPLESELHTALSSLDTINYPPVSVLSLGFRRNDVKHPLDGFGLLVPECENRKILGVLFPSSTFPERAPKGEILLAVFVGGTRQPEFATADTEALKAIVLPELKELLGVTGEPTFVHHKHWEKAIPQYTLGYDQQLAKMKQIEQNYPGLKLAGNYRTGISVTACIEAALIEGARSQK
jgi:oxygen-dependent protoporphyrinogen oxidase